MNGAYQPEAWGDSRKRGDVKAAILYNRGGIPADAGSATTFTRPCGMAFDDVDETCLRHERLYTSSENGRDGELTENGTKFYYAGHAGNLAVINTRLSSTSYFVWLGTSFLRPQAYTRDNMAYGGSLLRLDNTSPLYLSRPGGVLPPSLR